MAVLSLRQAAFIPTTAFLLRGFICKNKCISALEVLAEEQMLNAAILSLELRMEGIMRLSLSVSIVYLSFYCG
jgi:hypothetical protein